jgi:ATP-dependent DNA helicase PIF1
MGSKKGTGIDGYKKNLCFMCKMKTVKQKTAAIKHAILHQRKNIFFTGCAGTGKSTLLRSLIVDLEQEGFVVAITASTGLAASAIHGTTLHRFMGCGLATSDVNQLHDRIVENDEVFMRWINVDVLILDEISMISAELFDKFELLARLVRNNDRAFGGMQVLMGGDFLQLLAVNAKACFKSERFKQVIDETVELTDNFRQIDLRFFKVLCNVRKGVTTMEDVRYINEHCRGPLVPPKGVKPIYTMSHKKGVNERNAKELRKLPAEHRKVYMAQDIGTESIGDGDCALEKFLELRCGARVMLIYNYSDTLVNGSIGEVIGYQIDLPVVQFDNGERIVVNKVTWRVCRHARNRQLRSNIEKHPSPIRLHDKSTVTSRTQIPLKLAWAITIHKAQGQTFKWQVADVRNIFAEGQMYTAMSRVSDPNKFQVIGYKAGKHNIVCREYIEILENVSTLVR